MGRASDEELEERRHEVRADQPQGEEGRGEEAREQQEEGGPEFPSTAATADDGETTATTTTTAAATTEGQDKGRDVLRLHEGNERVYVDFCEELSVYRFCCYNLTQSDY